jgi:phage terminase large subunit-like protein
LLHARRWRAGKIIGSRRIPAERALKKFKRSLPRNFDIIAYLRTLAPEDRPAFVAMLTFEQLQALDRSWPSWAHVGQLPPAKAPDGSDWRTWVIMAGRGLGKTRAGAEWVTNLIRGQRDLRIALVGATIDEARRVMVEGTSGLLRVFEPWLSAWIPSRLLIRFKGGSEAVLFSGCQPDALRGPEHHFAWCDELAKWEKAVETWDMLQLGLRLGPHPRVIVTTTPRGGPVLTAIMARPGCARPAARPTPTRICPTPSRTMSSSSTPGRASAARSSTANS